MAARKPVTAVTSLSFAMAIALGTSAVGYAADANEGQALFEARCGDCHDGRDIARWAAQYPDADERQAWLDRFLQRHFPPGEEERPLIIDHIEGVIAEADDGG